MFCTKCGSTIPVGQKFCTKCGGKADAGTKQQQGARRSNAPWNWNLAAATKVAIAAAVVVLLGIGGYFGYREYRHRRPPTAVIASPTPAGNDSGAVTNVKAALSNLGVQPTATSTTATPALEPEPTKSMPGEEYAKEEPKERVTMPPPPPQTAAAMSATAAPSPKPAPVPTPASAPPPPQPVKKVIVLNAGTAIPVRITEMLDSKTAQANEVFHGTVAADMMSDGLVAIPQGTPVLGRVVEAKDAGHFRGRALLSIQLTEIDFGSNRMALSTNTLSTEGTARGKNTVEKMAGGGLFGGIVGTLAGGGKGAAIGTLAGAGAGTGMNAVTRGKQVEIPSETVVNFTLQQPLSFTRTIMPGSGQRTGSEPMLRQPNS